MTFLYIHYFYLGKGCGEETFRYAQNISSHQNGITDGRLSCRNRCLKTAHRSKNLECMCDPACMFLGDCCYDYLLECENREVVLDVALRKQLQMFRRFERYSSCALLNVGKYGVWVYFKMVTVCPNTYETDIVMKGMCEKTYRKQMMSDCIPVEWNGVVFRNMYCAACHGLTVHQVSPVSRRMLVVPPHNNNGDISWLPFDGYTGHFACNLDVKKALNGMKRYKNTCSCVTPLPIRSCRDGRFREECNAYSFVVFDDSSNKTYNNEACRSCDPEGKTNTPLPVTQCPTRDAYPATRVFDFTRIKLLSKNICEDFFEQGQSGDLCLMKHCQAGFEVHDNICMSVDTARACYPSRQNRHLPDYQIANLFRSALIIYYHCATPNDIMECTKYENMSSDTHCAQIPSLYNGLSPKNLPPSVQCAVFYFDTMAFGKLSGQIMAHDMDRVLFPKLKIFHTMLLNHDPFSGVTCAGGVHLNPMTTIQITKEGIVRIRSEESTQFYVSNKDPMIMTNTRGDPTIEMWTFNCRPQRHNKNCSAKLTQESLSHMNACLKYELTDGSSAQSGVIRLKMGKILKQGEFVTTDNGTILVCVELYEKLNSKGNVIFLPSMSYFLSITYLLTTFPNHI